MCKIHIEDFFLDFPVSHEIYVAVLRFLYGLLIFEATEDGSDAEAVGPIT